MKLDIRAVLGLIGLLATSSKAGPVFVGMEGAPAFVTPNSQFDVLFTIDTNETPLFGYSLEIDVVPQTGALGNVAVQVGGTNFFDLRNVVTGSGGMRDPLLSHILDTEDGGVFITTNTHDGGTVLAMPSVNDVLAQVAFEANQDAIGDFDIVLSESTAFSNSVGENVPYVFEGFAIHVVPEPSALLMGSMGVAVFLASQTYGHGRGRKSRLRPERHGHDNCGFLGARRKAILAGALACLAAMGSSAAAQSVPGDLDLDRDVDFRDAAFLAACLTGPGNPPDSLCTRADLNASESVDLADWAVLQNGFGFDEAPPTIERLVPLPGTWIVGRDGLSRIIIGFSEPVTIPEDAVGLWTVGAGSLTSFTLNNETPTDELVIALAKPVRTDRLTLVIDYTVVDRVGLELDGEIQFPSNALLRSGDRERGGQAVFRINVLQGDANRDGTVDENDAAVLTVSFGKCADDAGFDANADLNSDGCVNVLDSFVFSEARGRSLPATDTVAPQIVSFNPSPTAGLDADFASLEVTLTEPVSNDRYLNRRTLFLIDEAGALHVPSSVSVEEIGLKLRYSFEPPLPQCAKYTIKVSNALADDSGELLAFPATLPTIAASTVPPPAPDVLPDTTTTNHDAVNVDGTAPGAVFVEVAGPAIGTPGTPNTMYFPVENGAFEGSIPLGRNLVNHVFFTSISRCGLRSAPRAIAVTQDSAPPKLFIDFPPDGAELTLNAIDVAGRVGDLHSGAMGFSVTVNGQPAEADIGLGTNGTYLARAVPLLPGGPTTIEAVATDVFGHSIQKTITVSRVTPSPDEAQMVVVSGNGQSGMVNTDLAEPIVVSLQNRLGMPFVNKLVQFDIIRSDGQLRGTDLIYECERTDPVSPLKVQCRTDDRGEVRAIWTLGSDAGCGSNRIEVTSRDVQGSTFFCATSGPALARQINVSFGNSQSAFNNGQRVEVGSPACAPLRVFVNDGCNAVRDIPVTFTVTQGGGILKAHGQSGPSVIVNTDETGHAEVNFTLGPEPGNQRISATFPGNLGLPAEFVLYGVERQADRPTTLSGLVLSNANEPIQGCVCHLMINGVLLPQTVTDIDGRFRFDDIPNGSGLLNVNGFTATHVGRATGHDVPLGSYPILSYDIFVVPNADNKLPTPVLLPPLDPCNAVTYDGTQDVELMVKTRNPTSGLCEVAIDGFKMLVKAGSMRRSNGMIPTPKNPAILSLNQVHFDNIPMPMPEGAAPLIAWTLQPSGAKFDPPVQISYPNTGGARPGSIHYFFSFDHDTNRFEPIATGHVVKDGTVIVSDAGTGIDKAGWGGRCNPTPTGECRLDCEDIYEDIAEQMRTDFRVARALAEGLQGEVETIGDILSDIPTNIAALALAIPSIVGNFPVAILTELLNRASGLKFKLVGALSSIRAAEGRLDDAYSHLSNAAGTYDFLRTNCPGLGGYAFGVQLDYTRGYLQGVGLALALLETHAETLSALAGGLVDLIVNLIEAATGGATAIQQIAVGSPNHDCGSDIECLTDAIGELLAAMSTQATVMQDVFNTVDVQALPLIIDTLTSVATYSNCMVTVSGQTTVPNIDGTYSLGNVPATGGLNRVLAVCQGLDEVYYGASAYFDVPPNGVTLVSTFDLTTTPPPGIESLRSSASAHAIHVAETSQVRAIAMFSDGKNAVDVTDRLRGTTYQSSSPSIASVTNNFNSAGLVTAHQLGTVIIVASNEGATAVTQITVVPPGCPTSTVEGFVVDESGVPLLGARVFFIGVGGEDLTDDTGHFQISGVPACGSAPCACAAPLQVVAEFPANDAAATKGISAPLTPIANASSDAGIIRLNGGRYSIWLNPAGGNWTDAGNWHTGHVPTSDEHALIILPGTYTVIIPPATPPANRLVRGLTLGGPPSGGQTLILDRVSDFETGALHVGANGLLIIRPYGPNGFGGIGVGSSKLTVTSNQEALNEGAIVFDSLCYSTTGFCNALAPSSLSAPNGLLVNTGTIQTAQVEDGSLHQPQRHAIEASIDNRNVIDLRDSVKLGIPNGRLTNSGTLMVRVDDKSITDPRRLEFAEGMRVTNEGSIALEAGHIAILNNGDLRLVGKGVIGGMGTLSLTSTQVTIESDWESTLTVNLYESPVELTGALENAGTLRLTRSNVVGDGSLLNRGTIEMMGSTVGVRLSNDGYMVSHPGRESSGNNQITGSFSNSAPAILRVEADSGLVPGTLTIEDGFENLGMIELINVCLGGCQLSALAPTLEVSEGVLQNDGQIVLRQNGGGGETGGILKATLVNQGTITTGWSAIVDKPSARHVNRGMIDVRQGTFTINLGGGSFSNADMGTGSINVAAGSMFCVRGTCGCRGPGTYDQPFECR